MFLDAAAADGDTRQAHADVTRAATLPVQAVVTNVGKGGGGGGGAAGVTTALQKGDTSALLPRNARKQLSWLHELATASCGAVARTEMAPRRTD